MQIVNLAVGKCAGGTVHNMHGAGGYSTNISLLLFEHFSTLTSPPVEEFIYRLLMLTAGVSV